MWLQSLWRCLWEDTNIIVLVGPLGILLLDSLLCKGREKAMAVENFFLSLARATLDAHFVITRDEHLGLADYVDILSRIPLACLLVIAIRGKTGIIFDISDSTTEPLLNGKREKHSQGKKDSLYGKASLLHLITFSWLNPQFEVGVKKPIDHDEVPDIDFRDSA
ncbi:hypothetical protein RDI58_024534 [Solanum bulbocastanum]|uniref:Uncharacterized protein n=1 Tax=Solanum bulbocastanum TaxID=147425 RepID=A0AAN8T630_SOLBU